MTIETARSAPELGRSTRRTFLRWASALSALLTSVLVGIPSALGFLSPSFEKKIPGGEWVKLGEADLFDLAIPTKVALVSTIRDAWVENRVLRNVWVYTEDGEKFTVYNGRCTHLGCGYSYEQVTGRFKCPCHEGVFDVKTGAVLAGPPPRALDRLAVRTSASGSPSRLLCERASNLLRDLSTGRATLTCTPSALLKVVLILWKRLASSRANA